jgi:hypothetical protein
MMPAIALDLATTITIIIRGSSRASSGMMVSADLGAKRGNVPHPKKQTRSFRSSLAFN